MGQLSKLTKAILFLSAAVMILSACKGTLSPPVNTDPTPDTPPTPNDPSKEPYTPLLKGKVNLDKLLYRQYRDNIPVGYSERIYALYGDGLGFARDTVRQTGISLYHGMEVKIDYKDKVLQPSSTGTWYPSHVKTKIHGGSADIFEYKYVSEDDMAVCLYTIENKSTNDVSITFTAMKTTSITNAENKGLTATLLGEDFESVNTNRLSRALTVKPGESVTVKLALAFSDTEAENAEKAQRLFADPDPLQTHKTAFLGWFEENVPFFECDDKTITQTYYFRWYTYRNHIRLFENEQYVITEFLTHVSWAGKYNSINCAAPFHFYEGRWIKNPTYLQSYADFWFTEGANPRVYSAPMADAYYATYLVHANEEELTKHLVDLRDHYQAWVASHYDEKMGLFYQQCGYEGMEFSIGGDGYRPTVNSYMYGDAIAIAKIARMSGWTSLAEKYEAIAEDLHERILQVIWNKSDGFFETVSRTTKKSVDVREAVGFVPWIYHLPPDTATYGNAWAQLMDEEGFYAPYGPTTAERRDPMFMGPITGGNCHWNGPSWPFATSQTLMAAATYLNDYENLTAIDADDYFETLKIYAKSQYKNGSNWIAENINPITGNWIVDFAHRSMNYNHSSYCDLVISGLCGLRPEDNDQSVTVNPLIGTDNLSHFLLEDVTYRGHSITILYDKTGDRYDMGAGLFVYVDGKLAAHSDACERLTVPLVQS